MAIGWIRAYGEEEKAMKALDRFALRSDRAEFRSEFKTDLKAAKSDTAERVKRLKWGDKVILPDGLSTEEWTAVESGTKSGFVRSAHLVEVRWVKRTGGKKGLVKSLDTAEGEKDLLWGDLVQITKLRPQRSEVRARGFNGKMNTDDLTDQPLLEVYFIDVGQGDGILVRTPDGRHLLIDGGLERGKQQTGKNAADFVDWKFFFDYGHCRIGLDSMMASHSDTDHFGGLHDLVRTDELSERELDCVAVDIKKLHHPGLSRWTKNPEAEPPHRDGLGAQKNGVFIQLLGDRSDAEKAVDKNATERLSFPWKDFIRDVLANSRQTKVERVILDRAEIAGGGALPKLWPSRENCDIRVLGPVGRKVGSKLGLPDLGDKGKNTNGHSICLRLDFGKARILLTGDLNKKSMNWLAGCFGDRMGAWECDVAKACHHGSDDISYGFLEKMKAAATVISSGDAEGHSHPRPEIVGASAMTGFHQVDRTQDKLLTPLIYMTEIERSVSLGALNRLDFRQVPVGTQKVDGAVLGRNIDELNDKGYLTPEDRRKLGGIRDKNRAKKFVKDQAKAQKPIFEEMEEDTQKNRIRADFNLTVSEGPVSSRNVKRRAWRSRIMEKNHYGLVNVRTDGEIVMCATLDETEKKWVIHKFPARFPSNA